MSARTDLAAALTAALPGYDVIEYPNVKDRITRRTACVYQSQVRKAETFGLGWLYVDVTLWVLSSQQDPRRADDDLDEALMDVVAALQPLDWLEWTTAERLVLEDVQAPGYQITLTALANVTPLNTTPGD